MWISLLRNKMFKGLDYPIFSFEDIRQRHEEILSTVLKTNFQWKTKGWSNIILISTRNWSFSVTSRQSGGHGSGESTACHSNQAGTDWSWSSTIQHQPTVMRKWKTVVVCVWVRNKVKSVKCFPSLLETPAASNNLLTTFGLRFCIF